MNSSNHSEIRELLSRLSAVRRRCRAIETFRRSALLMAFIALLVLLAAMLDRFFHVNAPSLLIVDLVAVVSLAAYLGISFLRPLLQALSDERIAVHIENHVGRLDGRLINAVQLGKDEELSANPFTSVLVRQNCSELKRMDFSSSFPFRAARPAVLTCLGAVALFAVYGYRSPDHLANSLRRYLSPYSAPPPLTDTRIEYVEPGNTVVLTGSDLAVRTRLSGKVPSKLVLRVGTTGNWRVIGNPVLASDGRFEWTLQHITRPTDYQVLAGDARSQTYSIGLTAAPSIQSMEVTLSYPAYTGKQSETWQNHSGNIEALVGSVVEIKCRANKSLQAAELHRSRHEALPLEILPGKAGDDVVAEFTVAENETYWFKLVDRNGHPNVAPAQYAVVAIRDQPPSVQLLTQENRKKLSPTDTIEVRFVASDDYGLARAALDLEVTRAFDQSTRALPPSELQAKGAPNRLEDAFKVQLAELKVSDGDVVRYRVGVRDSLDQQARTATQSVTIVRPQSTEASDRALQLTHLERLQSLLVRQQDNLAGTRDVLELVGSEALIEELDRVVSEQVGIRKDAGGLAAELSARLTRIKADLRKVADGEMTEAIEVLRQIGPARRSSAQRRGLMEGALIQEEIVKVLARLASMERALVAADEKSEQSPEAAKQEADKQKEAQKSLDAFKNKVTKFYKEQKANVLDTQKLLDLPPDSDEAEALARKVMERQRLAKKLAREARDMTKVLAEEEITNEELVERMDDVFRAASDAAKAAEKKETRRTLLKEEMAILMASSIPDNGEAFLGGNGSKTKWDFEDWPEEERPETKLPPMAPDMHDTLGELIDRQEELEEDTDEMQSQMHFGATDNTGLIGGDGGPLSNMMGKGRSGNTTPKNNEVGGRAGSGRTGKSSGEFVESVDVAKEGRETEDRYTKEQAMEGFVKSKGDKKRAGGSTSSGGKRSDEATEFGLRGDAAINWSRQRMKLQGKQDDLRLKAELFANRLKQLLGRADFDVNAALLLMQEVDVDLTGGRFDHAVRKQVAALRHLKNFRSRAAAYTGHTETTAEATEKPKGRSVQRDDPLREKFPDEYRRMLREYYKALSEAAGK